MLRSLLAPSFAGGGLKGQRRQTGGSWGASGDKKKRERKRRRQQNNLHLTFRGWGGMCQVSLVVLRPLFIVVPQLLVYFLKPSCCCNTDH